MAGARPTKFIAATVKRLLDGIRAGLPVHLAAAAAGISETAFYEWQRGELPRAPTHSLRRSLRRI